MYVITDEPAFSLWLLPHLIAVLVPPLLGYVYLQRCQFLLIDFFFFFLLISMVYVIAAPAFESLADPRIRAGVGIFWVQRAAISSGLLFAASASLTCFVVMRAETVESE